MKKAKKLGKVTFYVKWVKEIKNLHIYNSLIKKITYTS